MVNYTGMHKIRLVTSFFKAYFWTVFSFHTCGNSNGQLLDIKYVFVWVDIKGYYEVKQQNIKLMNKSERAEEKLFCCSVIINE